MANKSPDRETAVLAVANSTTSGALVATAVNGTGFGRARFVFNFGSNANGASVNASSVGIYQAATSGGTYSAIASAVLAAISSGAISNQLAVIDVPISSGTPWLEVSGNVVNGSIYVNAIAELYGGTEKYAPTALEQQVVTV